jgi:flavin-dependent dehydrogenase
MEMSQGVLDLAIIGGGPAGTAAALAARASGSRVAVWDRQTFPHDKVCGEFISGESLPLLERLIPAALRRSASIARCEFISPHGQVDGFTLPQPARGLSRRCLDHALWQAAAGAGALTHEGTAIRCVNRLAQRGGAVPAWQLKTADGEVITSRSLLLACGRWWSIEGLASPLAGLKSRANAWTGLKAHFTGIALCDAVEMYYFPGGYCGLAPIEDGTYNVCCLVHSSLLKEAGESGGSRDLGHWLQRVAQHPALEARLEGAAQASATLATAPVSPATRRAALGGALVIGDAAGFIDPFTGDGISMALHSGLLAAEILSSARNDSPRFAGEHEPGSEYRRRLREAVGQSYWFAGLLRKLVGAPEFLQAAAARFLPRLGPTLMERTRWRAMQNSLPKMPRQLER